MKIFVSIASYRDPELAATINDCIDKARFPKELRFGICWQHTLEDAFPVSTDSRFRIIDIDWRRSKGVCCARSAIMSLWDDEDFYLQIDSHQRFVEEWDAKLLDIASSANSAKPIITTYCPYYTPNASRRGSLPTKIEFHAFAPDGLPLLKPAQITGQPLQRNLYRARFLSAGFLFTIGKFVKEVPYDPELYFNGEEISMAMRAYTWGYDLFHPAQVLGWHYYTRKDNPKHWEDQDTVGNDLISSWREQDQASRARVRQLLIGSYVGPFGCGPVRSIAEYEAYAGISFRHMKVQDYTRLGAEPPNPAEHADWYTYIQSREVTIKIDCDILPQRMLMAAEIWLVSIYDSSALSSSNRLLAVR